MPSRSGSSFGDNSSSGSNWTTTYRNLPKKQPAAIRFMSWAAGAPRGATVVKKRTRDIPDDQSDMSAWSSGSYWSEPDTQLYWVASPDRYYSGSSSSSSRSSRSSRKGHGSGRKGSRRGKHFDGVPPPQPMMPPPPGHEFDHPMGGHYPPPPPPGGDMDGGHYGGGGFPHPPPMHPVNPGPPAGDQPAFFDLSGHQGFNRGGPPHGYHNPEANDDYWSESGSDTSSMTS